MTITVPSFSEAICGIFFKTKKKSRKHPKSTKRPHELSPKKKANVEAVGINISQTQRQKFLFDAIIYQKVEI